VNLLQSAGLHAAVLLALVAGAAPVVQAQQLLPEKSYVRFVSKQMNVPVEGIFRKFTAQIVWNAAKPEASSARIELDPGSIDLGMEDINKEARGKDWFDTAAQPRATFISTTVKMSGAGRYEAAGKLTIKGRTRDVVASFSAKPDAGVWCSKALSRSNASSSASARVAGAIPTSSPMRWKSDSGCSSRRRRRKNRSRCRGMVRGKA